MTPWPSDDISADSVLALTAREYERKMGGGGGGGGAVVIRS